jgi:hypothetical protein
MTAALHEYSQHPASYRDPAGFVFRVGSIFYRQVNRRYAADFDLLIGSGLYAELTRQGLLLAHEEKEENLTGSAEWFKTLLPEQLDFIHLPEEWSPLQLKLAALCTLAILRTALSHGMILKDATPRNIQFRAGKAVLIDTLSFERYDPALPWIAYRQFCECFLYPLLLHHYHGEGVHRTVIAWPDGIPAAVTARLLPARSRWKLGVQLHVLLPAKMSGKSSAGRAAVRFSADKLLQLVANLESVVSGLRTGRAEETTWSNYYDVLGKGYLEEKERVFREWVSEISFSSALDLGANEGCFSKILAERGGRVIAAEADWKSIQVLHGVSAVHAVCVDIANPTPATGFDNRERAAFTERAASDLVCALALIHHLVLAQNIPLTMVAGYFAELARQWLIIEFVPLSDEKCVELLRNKPVYPGPYEQSAFEAIFGVLFTIERQAVIPGTNRVLYCMKKKPHEVLRR